MDSESDPPSPANRGWGGACCRQRSSPCVRIRVSAAVKAPPDASIAECIRELGEAAVGYTPASGANLKQQLRLAAFVQLTGTSVPGW